MKELITNIIIFIFILLISFVIDFVIKKVLFRAIKKYSEKTKTNWDNIIIEKKVLSTFIKIIPFVMLNSFAYIFSVGQIWIERISFSAIILIILASLDKLIMAVNEIYNNYEISRFKPIKWYLQVIQIVLFVIAIIFIVSIILDKSPWYLLSGLGAITAILVLVFQNSILGLVAGIEITANDMLQIGDWIEMSKYGADGKVVEITLHTIKVQNFDMTITTIPSHLLISDSFKNWRGMQQAGCRRIMRHIYIDMNSVRLYKNSDIDELFSKKYIAKYLDESIRRLSKDRNDDVTSVNFTNIGMFRLYLENYLRNHPGIRHDFTIIVRQLQPTEKGLPIEVYAFTTEIQWEKYEAIQSDIFEHILAVIREFNIRVYQEPSGYDLQKNPSVPVNLK